MLSPERSTLRGTETVYYSIMVISSEADMNSENESSESENSGDVDSYQYLDDSYAVSRHTGGDGLARI